MFLSASQDKSGTLDVIEEKIARATMLPRTNGEVLFSIFLDSLAYSHSNDLSIQNHKKYRSVAFPK